MELVNKKINCNICSGVVTVNETKLENTYPEIAQEYCPIKNKKKLSDVSCYSDQKVWWLCKNNHYWENPVSARTGNKYKNKEKTKCPYCWSTSHSRNELIIFSELHQFFKEVFSGKKIKRKEMDIFIKDLKLAIEYDGSNWHKDIKKDKEKNKILKENNIKLIRIREYPLDKIEENDFVYNIENDLFEVIKYILNFILKEYEFPKTTKRKIKEYIKNKNITNEVFFKKVKDYYKIKPIKNKRLIKEYDKEKNSLPIHYYGASSKYKAFWKCTECNLEYKKKINQRTRHPNCHNCREIELNKKGKNKEERKRYREKLYYNRRKKKLNKILVSNREFEHGLTIKETHPKILLELPSDRLAELKELSHTNSRIYFNTKCYNCNHVFKTNMWNKVKEKQTCPNCNFNILTPETDLLKNYPNLKNGYHKDNTIDLRYTTIEYPKLLKWVCKKGHVTEKTIDNHIKYGDCLECNKGKKIIDIPRIINTWDYEKNNPLGLDPKELTIGSKKIANFKCSLGADHLWSAKIIKRRKYNCPFCANQKLSTTNKLTTTHPEIAALWSAKNNSTPDMYMVGNAKTKFLWNCEFCKEEFSKEIKQMQRTDGMCPCCKTYNLGSKKGKKKGEV